MTATLSSEEDRLTPLDTVSRHSHLATLVLCRLQQRSQIARLAREIHEGMKGAVGLFVGEADTGHICAGPGGGTRRFECAKNDFTCSTFTCAETITYGKCEGAADAYECKKDFDCTQSAYDCHDFDCGDSGAGTGAFNCDNDVDFVCGGPAYDCFDDFDCKAGHIFSCTDKHECKDDFSCAATGNTKCDETFPYSRPDDGGTDKTPGDFVCGLGGGDADDYDCLGKFTCTAKDEFDCAAETDFNCGTGDAGDKFECGSATRFECDPARYEKFDCTPSGNFKCLGTYVPPPGE